MTVDIGAPYQTRVQQALGDGDLRTALNRATERLSGQRAAAMAAVDYQQLRDEARSVRQYAIEHLPELLEQLEENLVANGCEVHWARDADEAGRLICEIADRYGVRHVVKSKSMVTEEIHLNKVLESSGIRVVETDLGEYIIQLADEPPSHITAPVIHKRTEDISELFQEKLGMHPTTDAVEMCAVARETLRSEFLAADMGISGCNFAVAETGTVCIVTNEGNGRMVTSMPRVYVAVAGIEKVVRGIGDAVLLWQAATRSATGQEATVYFSMSSGPRGERHADGPEAMHVVLLDNGRSRILERGYADALLCIRCGACLNECPVYREIGGHAYGPTAYSGPIGAVITPLLADNMADVRELPNASSLCGACRDVCPVKIDLPRLLLDLRGELVDRHPEPLLGRGAASLLERIALKAYSGAARSRRLFQGVSRIAGVVSRLVAGGEGKDLNSLPPPLDAWTKTRSMPPLPAKSFRERWRERERERSEETSND
jgi:L-lactate dehydrogenase complex protein LldF